MTKLRAARPDVLFHTGYNPDINLFLNQAREQGLRVRVYVGHGAGHSQLAKLKEAFGKDAEGFHTSDPPASQLIDASKLKPGVAAMTQEMVKRYKAFEPDISVNNIAPHVSMGFNNMWILLNDVLPRAIQKHGGWTAEALAAAARETDIPEGGTMQGYGVKFAGEGNPMRGQNERAIAAVYQVVDGQFRHVWPPVIATPEIRRFSCPPRRPGRPADLDRHREAGAPRLRLAALLVLTVDRLTKQFGGFTALNAVSFEVKRG